MVNTRPISFYLRLKVENHLAKQIIKLLQPAYINKILSRFYLKHANTIIMPIKKSILLQIKIEGQVSTAEKKIY